MAPRRGFLNFSMILPRRRRDGSERQGFSFARVWLACLPLSIAAIAGSILVSGGDPEHRPFLIFGVGVIFGVIGLLSLFVGLIQAGNIERARRRAREAARAKDLP